MPYKDPLKNAGCKKRWALANKEKMDEKNRLYKLNNPEKVKESKAKWRQKNKEKQYELTSKWRENNRARYNFLHAKRRAIKMNATPKWLNDADYKLISEFYEMAKELEKVFPWKQHVDHIIPLQNDDVCGLHVPNNLQILSVWQNQVKNNIYSEPQ